MRKFQIVVLMILGVCAVDAQPPFQTDFPREEFVERRARVFDAIGRDAIAIIQGAPVAEGFLRYRQWNDFYYLCGVETPHSYLLLNGRTRKAILYMPHRDAAKERTGGAVLSAEDAELAMRLTGVDEVYGTEQLAHHLASGAIRPPAPVLYTPFSPGQGMGGSRDELLGYQAELASDPWDGRTSRTSVFLNHLRQRFPSYELRDLTGVLDKMRLIKTDRELTLIRRATQIAGRALMEAMRSTRPGIHEYELDAVTRYVFLAHGAMWEGYPSITAGGTNAWFGHYQRNQDVLKDGDMILLDYAPDYRYYTSDVTRMWPVNGRYTPDQRAMAKFILAYRDAFIKRVKPGVTGDSVLDQTASEMREYLKGVRFSKEIYRKAAEEALRFRGHLQHPVGMTVHDVGTVRAGEFAPGQVFTIDPMVWVPEERLYIRMEDVLAVTRDGVENMSAFVPGEPDAIEALMREPGLLQMKPPRPF